MELERAGRRVLERLDRDRPAGAPSLLSGVIVTVGQRPRVEGLTRPPTMNPEANIATVEFKLLSVQERDMSTIDVMQAWRDEVGGPPIRSGDRLQGRDHRSRQSRRGSACRIRIRSASRKSQTR